MNENADNELPALVGLAEAATLLGLSKGALSERRRSGRYQGRLLTFPEPIARLACGPVWLHSQIEDYRSRLDGQQRPLWDEEREALDERLEQALCDIELSDLQGGNP